MFTRATIIGGWHIPTYKEKYSREWSLWLEFWSDVFMRHYYPTENSNIMGNN